MGIFSNAPRITTDIYSVPMTIIPRTPEVVVPMLLLRKDLRQDFVDLPLGWRYDFNGVIGVL